MAYELIPVRFTPVFVLLHIYSDPDQSRIKHKNIMIRFNLDYKTTNVRKSNRKQDKIEDTSETDKFHRRDRAWLSGKV